MKKLSFWEKDRFALISLKVFFINLRINFQIDFSLLQYISPETPEMIRL